MYTLKITPWDRLQLDLCLPRNVPLAQQKQLLRIMTEVALTDEEKAAIDWALLSVQSQGGMVSVPVWDPGKLDTKKETVEVHLETAEFIKLRELAKERQNWPLDVRAGDMLDLLDSAEED